jgi:penicillin-insensitive murein endopeptidase
MNPLLRSFSWLATSCCLGGCVGVPSPLAPSQKGTVGVPHLGVQTEAVELPVRGEGFLRFRALGRHYWGLPRLVKTLEAAAEHVAKVAPDSAPLVVGDLSARYGGKIQGHNSHRSGRDVDLLYYVTTPAGASIPCPGFVRLEADGLGYVPGSGEYVRFDVERQWQLVKFLLTSREVGVQFMFVSRGLEALLIEYALARGEPLALVNQAQTVLLQPTDSMPHDDHLHLRIACAPDEGVSGCTGGGPYWEWLPQPEAPPELDQALLSAIAEDDPWPDEQSLANTVGGTPGGA